MEGLIREADITGIGGDAGVIDPANDALGQAPIGPQGIPSLRVNRRPFGNSWDGIIASLNFRWHFRGQIPKPLRCICGTVENGAEGLPQFFSVVSRNSALICATRAAQLSTAISNSR